MSRRLKTLIVTTILTLTFLVSAYATSVNYNVSALKYLMLYVNDTATSKTLFVNTKPASGYGGAFVSIEKSDGEVICAKTFPYYTDTTPLSAVVPVSQTRRIYVKPATPGQTVVGVLNYWEE